MREDVVRGIGEERAALLGLLAAVSGDTWDRPTVCTGWSVKDVLAHIVEGELNVGRVYRGETREPGYVDPASGVAKWTALPGEAVRAALWQHGTATQRALESMTDEAWRAPITAFGCRQVSQLARLHLFDLVVHGHDVSDALGAPPMWEGRVAFAAQFCVRAAAATLTRLGAPPEGSLAVRLEGSDETWVVDGTSGVWRVVPGVDGRSSAAIAIEPADLVLATTGRCRVDEALARATVQGDPETAARILGRWQVVAAG